MRRSRLFALTKGATHEFLTDNCPHLAAAICFYLLFSLFPLTLAAASVLGFLSRSPEFQAKLILAIGDLIPISSDYITGAIEGVVGARGALGAVATVGLLWAGTSVFNAVRKSLNTAWGVRQPRPFLHERLMELGMMAGVGLLLLVSVGLTTGLQVVRHLSLPGFWARFVNGDIFWNLLVVLTSTSLVFFVFLFLYRFVPNTRVRWRDVWMGALVGAVLFEVAKNAFVWFAGSFANYGSVYGSLGTIIAFLTWTYVSAVILLFCAKLTSMYPRAAYLLAGKTGPEGMPHPEAAQPKAYYLRSPARIILGIAAITAIGMDILRRVMLRRA